MDATAELIVAARRTFAGPSPKVDCAFGDGTSVDAVIELLLECIECLGEGLASASGRGPYDPRAMVVAL